jgi:DnaK suppressor protein
MTQENKEQLKKEIKEQISQTAKDLKELKKKAKAVSSDRSHGRMGQLNAIEQKNAHVRRIEALESRLHGLESSLLEIDDEFGKCEVCGEPIGKKRLEALPGVKRCIKCAGKLS